MGKKKISKGYIESYRQKIVDDCDVIDINGNHCPEMPVHQFKRDGEIVSLCNKCYKKYNK